MKFRTTGILLLVFVVLLGYVYFFELHKKPAETPTDKSTWILTLGADDVQRLTVNDQGNTIVLARSGDIWSIGDVGGEEADATRVSSITASLVNLQATRVLTDTAEGLAAYGLEPPVLTVTVGLSGTQEMLYIGNKNVQGTQYYLQRKGQSPVYLVYAALVDDLKLLVSEPPFKPTPTPAVEPTAPPAGVAPATTPKP